MKPTQAARYFEGLSTNTNFDREYDTQDGVPVDGANNWLRTLSPFVIRALPPLIFSDPSNTQRVNQPTFTRGEGGALVAEGTNPRSYSAALTSTNRLDPALNTYENLINVGGNIPGIDRSVSEIDLAYHNIAVTEAARNSQSLGGRTQITPAVTNNTTGISILRQLRRLVDTPPLVLLINPASLSIQYNKIAQFQERSRYGYIYQAWGEELVKLSVSCRVGAFVAGKRNPSQSNVPSGVQFASKNDSASFQQLMAVLTMFQSSAYIVDTVSRSKSNYMIGNIAIEYDQNVYVGHMDSFNYTYDEAEQNGGMKFDFDFTAVRTYDTATSKSFISPLTNPNTNASQPTAGGTVNRWSRTWQGNDGGAEATFFTAPTIGTSGQSIPQPWRRGETDTLLAPDGTGQAGAATAGGLLETESRPFSTFDGRLVNVESNPLTFSPVSPDGNPVYVASSRAYAEVPVLEEQVTYTVSTSANTAIPILTSRRS